MTTFLRIRGRDPLVARDGRPFGAGQGNRMRSVGWPFPSVVAGSFRTALAKSARQHFDDPTIIRDLLQTVVAGVLPATEDELYLPAPCDCVIKDESTAFRARPEPPRTGEGGDWPGDGLWPVVISAHDDFKPLEGPAYWPMRRYAQWLKGETFAPTSKEFSAGPRPDVRDHVSIEAATGAAEEGLLFTTEGVAPSALPRYGERIDAPASLQGPRRYDRFTEVDLAARVEGIPAWAQPSLPSLSTWHPLGGERRLAHWSASDDNHLWACPSDVATALAGTTQVTMTLATPGLFCGGWKPSWLSDNPPKPPFPGAPQLRLVGVCIQRWKAVSGWSLAPLRTTGKPGPKAIKRVVPASGVYFFKAEGPTAALASDGWLRPVSDDPQDCRDGFGLAVWGTW